jgi:ubiquinone/menaquinone biosynthesis C-methylase UbiE
MLDPAVEILDAEVDEHRLLCHRYFEVGMVVPPGEGLLDFVTVLVDKPIGVAALREGFDDQHLVEAMLTALRQHGFLHLTAKVTPTSEELLQLRREAEEIRRASLCHSIVRNLDSASAEDIRIAVEVEAIPPQLQLRCGRLGDQAATLAELGRRRQAGQLHLHSASVQATDLTCDAEVIQSLRRLGAAVIAENVPWPAPEGGIAGLDALTGASVPVYALMSPDLSLMDATARAQALAWAGSVYLTGLRLELDPSVLWPGGEPTEEEFAGAFEAIRALDETFGDVSIANLPSDEVVLGQAAAERCSLAQSDTTCRLRIAYLRWRLPLLKASEGDNTFSQTPEAEEKLIRAQEDLLPNHPELLGVESGSVVVDVCGGNGRVARRLSPLVGPDGLVISVEMLRSVTDRARRFACDLGFTNLQFRTGLAQRLPLPDGSVDAAVNEWTGGIWELGLGQAMVAEMTRVVRPGGRVAVTHRLVRLPLTRLRQPWVQFDDIYAWMQAAFARPELTIVVERIWGQTASSLVGEKATAWRKHYLPRLVNPFDVTYTDDAEPGPHADVCLTIIAERRT